MTSNGVTPRNNLLMALSPSDRIELLREAELVEIEAGATLHAPNEPIVDVFFPESGIASVVAVSQGRRIETGPFGWDGMSGLPVVLASDRSPSQVMVQIKGVAHKVKASALSSLIDTSPPARQLFLRYAQTFGLQAAHTALAAGVAHVERRLARWLLMLHDRIDGDELALTHDFMAMMLAVRRPGVTVAVQELEGRGLVRGYRGRLIIRDRKGLMKLCGSLYGIPEAEYERLIPGGLSQQTD